LHFTDFVKELYTPESKQNAALRLTHAAVYSAMLFSLSYT